MDFLSQFVKATNQQSCTLKNIGYKQKDNNLLIVHVKLI